MKRLLCVVMALVAIAATASTANAQEYPKSEIYATYSGLLADIDVSHAILGHGLDGYDLGFQYNLANTSGWSLSSSATVRKDQYEIKEARSL